MTEPPLECPYCRASQLEEFEGEGPCGGCGRRFSFFRFHARRPGPARVEGAVGRTPCFQHPGNTSVTACDRCGSFLCALCDTRAEGRGLCPPCFDRLHSEGRLQSTRREVVAWGRLVMVLGAFALFPFYGCGFGAVAVGVGLYGLARMRKENTTGGRRWVIAGMSLGLAGLLLWTILIGAIFWSSRPRAALRAAPAVPVQPKARR